MVRVFTLLILAALFFVNGCRKQVSTLQDTPKNPVEKTVVEEANPFEGLDTSSEVSFVEADLASELAEKVKQNLQTVYFDFNSYQINSVSIEKLVVAAKFLKENMGLRILIKGHCDERGSSEYNMGLGEKRAKAVKDFFLNYGIQPIRLEATSLGKEQPAIPMCGDDSCHMKNRRAEFAVLGR